MFYITKHQYYYILKYILNYLFKNRNLYW